MKFDELYKNHARNVLIIARKYCFRKSNDDILDISQIFWMRLFKGEYEFENDGHFNQFAHTSIKNIAIDLYRKEICDLDKNTRMLESMQPVDDSMVKEFEFKNKLRKITKHMAKSQLSIIDYWLAGYNQKSIMEMTQKTQFIVRKTLEYAAKKVQEIC